VCHFPIPGKKAPAEAGAGVGGGGGTADPYFSIWAGLFLHLPKVAGEGVYEFPLQLQPILVLHGILPVGAYESLAGLSVSRSPDGVGIGHCPLAFTV
jgi:hypothetical protein